MPDKPRVGWIHSWICVALLLPAVAPIAARISPDEVLSRFLEAGFEGARLSTATWPCEAVSLKGLRLGMTREDVAKVYPNAKWTKKKRLAKDFGTDEAWLLWAKATPPPEEQYSLYVYLGVDSGKTVLIRGAPDIPASSDQALLSEFIERFGVPSRTTPMQDRFHVGLTKGEIRGHAHHWVFEDCGCYLRLSIGQVDSTYPSPLTGKRLPLEYPLRSATLCTLTVMERLREMQLLDAE